VISKINEAWIVVYYRNTLISAKPKLVCFWLSEKPTSLSHLQALVLGLVWSDISGRKKVHNHPNGAL